MSNILKCRFDNFYRLTLSNSNTDFKDCVDNKAILVQLVANKESYLNRYKCYLTLHAMDTDDSVKCVAVIGLALDYIAHYLNYIEPTEQEVTDIVTILANQTTDFNTIEYQADSNEIYTILSNCVNYKEIHSTTNKDSKMKTYSLSTTPSIIASMLELHVKNTFTKKELHEHLNEVVASKSIKTRYITKESITTAYNAIYLELLTVIATNGLSDDNAVVLINQLSELSLKCSFNDLLEFKMDLRNIIPVQEEQVNYLKYCLRLTKHLDMELDERISLINSHANWFGRLYQLHWYNTNNERLLRHMHWMQRLIEMRDNYSASTAVWVVCNAGDCRC